MDLPARRDARLSRSIQVFDQATASAVVLT